MNVGGQGDDDWIDALFAAMREEVISISIDFAPRVKRRIDLVADALGLRPPSATSLLTAVSLETTNIIASTIRPVDDKADPEEES